MTARCRHYFDIREPEPTGRVKSTEQTSVEQWRTRRCFGAGTLLPGPKGITMLKAQGKGVFRERRGWGNMGNTKKHNGCLQFVNEHNANITSAPLFLAESRRDRVNRVGHSGPGR